MAVRKLSALCALLFAGCPAWAAAPSPAAIVDAQDTYAGRTLFVHVPARLPAAGARALVIVLHGGLGSAQRILSGQAETGLNLDVEADRDGFVVAYLNGTPVTRLPGVNLLGWNAGGGCCGQSASNNVDDVRYVDSAVAMLVAKHGIDPHRVYGIGHSNGAMMLMRMVCESDSVASAISIAGPLNTDDARCTHAKGKRILGLHGEADQNVPIAGGVGPRGVSRVEFKSEERTRRVLDAAGAQFELQVLPGTDHFLNHIEETVRRIEGVSLPEKAARYFGLAATIPP